MKYLARGLTGLAVTVILVAVALSMITPVVSYCGTEAGEGGQSDATVTDFGAYKSAGPIAIALALTISVLLRIPLYRKNRSLVILNREMLRKAETESALRALLQVSKSGKKLDAILHDALDVILSISWLSLESKGAIFICNLQSNRLILKASRRLDKHVVDLCRSVPFGTCPCGIAASRGKYKLKILYLLWGGEK